MNVLIIPVNIVSIPSLTTYILTQKGLHANCISYLNSTIHQNYSGTTHIPCEGSILKKPLLLFNRVKLYWLISKYFLKADIIHWIYRVPPPVLYWKFLTLISKRKVHFVEFLGTDTRTPSKLMNVNPYYKEIYNSGYEYKDIESDENSEIISEIFSKFKAIPLLAPEMMFYNRVEFFPNAYILFQRIDLNQFNVVLDKTADSKIKIVHSPTKQITKGSKYVELAIKRLEKEFENIEYVKVVNVSRQENINIVKSCDIFLDQFIIGGYGMAATEAMAMGKPVLCFLLNELYECGLPEECPIVNTNPEQIYENLKKLILDQSLREELGRKSRAYVEKYHDADKVCDLLIEIYKKELGAL